VSNAGGVGKTRDSEPVSGSIECCEQCYTLSCDGMWRVDNTSRW